MFSRRLPPRADVNALARAVARCREEGTDFIDLTESNPTRAGIPYPDDLLVGLATTEALRYEPSPLGMRVAREAVARDCLRRGVVVDPAHVVVAASTSEAYTWLFKLLCNPGESVLVPRPSYPLFEHLTRLEGIETATFDLEYHGRWEIDVASLDAAPDSTRAVILVSPNNPTGSYVSRREIEQVSARCQQRGWALIADEVFADYALEVTAPPTDLAVRSDVLAFTLGGLSKSVGLPQVKLGWIVVGGPAAARDHALSALELIADSFLSVSTPVQLAACTLLARGADVRAAIRDRIRINLSALREVARSFTACDVPVIEGGWSAIIRVPAIRSEEALVLGLLEQHRVLAHPGYFFDCRHEAFVVVSLLPPPEAFREATARLFRFATA
jgi:aspartate/methionine/tyrosine aminotransferase